LRQLRKATSDYEAQNAVLQRHVDSLYAAVNRLESETNQQRTTNQTLQRHLDSLRSQLAGCFATIPLPGEFTGKIRVRISFRFDVLFVYTNISFLQAHTTVPRYKISTVTSRG
jgi:hypothetical protein